MYQRIIDEIHETAIKCGRDPNSIQLIAVSKTHPWAGCEALYTAGCRNFGENRVQEALPKMSESPEDIQWHLIGTLQKNKVNKVIGKFHLIHSLDSLPLAEKLSQASQAHDLTTNCLIQINTSKELSKQGLDPLLAPDTIAQILSLPNLSICGLMTIGPLTGDPTPAFTALRNLRDLHFPTLPHLSMGMSHDFRAAIRAGATLLRIGTALFGKRSEK